MIQSTNLNKEQVKTKVKRTKQEQKKEKHISDAKTDLVNISRILKTDLT